MKSNKISQVRAREILASGGYPSVEVRVVLESGVEGRASVAYGVSAGSKEAVVLLDGDMRRYNGQGMLKAVGSVNEKIAPLIIGCDALDQRGIDELMIKADGTQNKSSLGANAILGVSMAVARAAAVSQNLELYSYLRQAFGIAPDLDDRGKLRLPKPMPVLIEGGRHADNSTDLQEYLLCVLKEEPAAENVRMAMEIYHQLKKLLKAKGYSTNVGNEGAFAPQGLTSNELPIELIVQGIAEAGYTPGQDAGVSLDPAASEFYSEGKYNLAVEKREVSPEELIEIYLNWFKKYPIITCEDPLSEFDWEHWPQITAKAGSVPIVADDLTVTNVKLWQKAIDEKAANAILIKLNQAGTVTETLDCCLLAKKYNYPTIPSHRGGGETNDTFLVDLAVAVGSAWIKVGPTRGERVCKYNRLMEIETQL